MNNMGSLHNLSDNDWDLAFGGMSEHQTSEYTCPFCGKLIKNNSNLIWVNKHDKSFKCPGCNEKVYWLE